LQDIANKFTASVNNNSAQDNSISEFE